MKSINEYDTIEELQIEWEAIEFWGDQYGWTKEMEERQIDIEREIKRRTQDK